jgi:hypothetical protein
VLEGVENARNVLWDWVDWICRVHTSRSMVCGYIFTPMSSKVNSTIYTPVNNS